MASDIKRADGEVVRLEYQPTVTASQQNVLSHGAARKYGASCGCSHNNTHVLERSLDQAHLRHWGADYFNTSGGVHHFGGAGGDLEAGE
ncbi:hypothetical protein F8388_012421 [Cannabis sativa]|uniref:Uncharacterized protein n=1 Tax=Cannabis sativa TaxID=3483 RepID=A0A7J6E3B7_CANSA|nr:hypothetical protein G4B88_026367 [Cannabis sativa]KAF4388444.1 hypothetical protein F8388_012421 [Cannabis sativa]